MFRLALMRPRFLAGVRPAQPGFAEVLIAPRPAWLATVDARVPTPRGSVRVQLDDTHDGRWLRIETPVTAHLDLATPHPPSQTLPAGNHELKIAR